MQLQVLTAMEEILQKIPRQKISCISGCAVAQADKFGMGGMFQTPLAELKNHQ